MKLKLMTLLNSKFRDFNTRYIDLEIKGVYAIYEGNKVIYVGESYNIQRRLNDLLKGNDKSHTLRRKLYGYNEINSDEDVNNFLKMKCKFRVLKEFYGARLEGFAIGILKPKFNELVGKKKYRERILR